MPKGDKYIGLKHYLKNTSEPVVKLTFEQIEKIIGDTLPESSKTHVAWWSNNYDHSQAVAWMDAGYETEFVSDTYRAKYITFRSVK